MPFYDYECMECGNKLTLQKRMIDSNSLPLCYTCEKKMKKLLSAVPIIYKADGFFTPKSQQ